MAEVSRFWTTSGTGDGPGGGYTAQQMYDFLRRVFIQDQEAVEGVLFGVLNELAVSTPSATNLNIATGAAIVYGFFYENSATLTINFTPPAATTGGRVVLEVDWTAQTVRGKVLLNTSGVTSPPAVTQSAGSTWQLSLATFTTDNAGNVSGITDTRTFAHFATRVSTAMIEDDAITVAKQGPLSVDTAALGNLSVSTGKIINDAVDDTKLRNSGALSVIGRAANSTGDPADITAGTDAYVLRRSGTTLGFGQITTGGIANDAVDSTKLGTGAIQIPERQGGSATHWAASGGTTYSTPDVRMVVGAYDFGSIGIGASSNVSVTFPTAFSYNPVCFVGFDAGSSTIDFAVSFTNITTTGMDIYVTNTHSAARTIKVFWMAIGPTT